MTKMKEVEQREVNISLTFPKNKILEKKATIIQEKENNKKELQNKCQKTEQKIFKKNPSRYSSRKWAEGARRIEEA